MGGATTPASAVVTTLAPTIEVGGQRAELAVKVQWLKTGAESTRLWTAPPDVVSLNLVEAGSIELGHVLLERGIGIEAGVFTHDDVDRLLAAPWAGQVRRVLVEVIFEHEAPAAVELARALDARVAGLGRPRLWHGDGQASWAVVDAALEAGHDVRVGLEDSLIGRDGGPAAGNAGQVAEIGARTS